MIKAIKGKTRNALIKAIKGKTRNAFLANF